MPEQDTEDVAGLVASLDVSLVDAQPYHVVQAALKHFGGRLSVAFSGAEDVVLIDLVSQLGGKARYFCLDTGRLHAETYAYLQKVRDHYGIELELMFPQATAVQSLVQRKGLFSFRVDGHKECCGIRKVEPLRRALADTDAWMTGQRRDQSPDTRAEVPLVQLDTAFGSRARPLVKFNPLAGWTSAQVWRYLRSAQIPFNPLHERGFVSIGCEPCTRPVLPGQHEREGRWWWELADDKECGLHVVTTDEG
jgi:phosphoadenosine phosphosulfate reductase